MLAHVMHLYQGSQSHTGGCTGLASGTMYFGTGQYRCTISSLPLFKIYIYIYILFVYILKKNKYYLYIYNFNYLVKVNLLSH